MASIQSTGKIPFTDYGNYKKPDFERGIYKNITGNKTMERHRNDLITNIDKLHTTEMGAERIKKNLTLETDDVVHWCKIRILDEKAVLERKGKNSTTSKKGR